MYSVRLQLPSAAVAFKKNSRLKANCEENQEEPETVERCVTDPKCPVAPRARVVAMAFHIARKPPPEEASPSGLRSGADPVLWSRRQVASIDPSSEEHV
mmetsp:Transcript_145569/g.369324  ORF Transcript_145569/g.369324 Transcript_145569/m.369324 type:complete len:99 (+) Transcript_145569:670-966(+)